MDTRHKKTLTTSLLVCVSICLACLAYLKYHARDGQTRNNAMTPLNSVEENAEQDETPLEVLFSEEIISEYLASSEPRHKPETIQDEPKQSIEERRGFLRPEEQGEDFSLLPNQVAFDKLENGDKIEQRKAAEALWKEFGSSADRLTSEEQLVISRVVKRCLSLMNSDYEENFLQLHRLWHLAAPCLIDNILNNDSGISENAAMLLSLMKTREIMMSVIAQTNSAMSEEQIQKAIFALEYLKVNNRVLLDRPQMPVQESEQCYKEYVVPQIMELKGKN